MEKKFLILIGCFIFLSFPKEGLAKELEVGGNQLYESISAALKEAEEGDIINVHPRVYNEKLEIGKSITLRSVQQHEATIVGDYEDYVITVNSPDVVIDGFQIKASGHNFLDNDAGILINQVDGIEISNNRFEDILFGIYIDSSENHVIKNNVIHGLAEKKLSERGNGIHFYNTRNNLVEGNTISETRDGMYFDHSDGTTVINNHITDVRYGLHYMWSNHNIFRKNYFSHNVSGAAIMFSKSIQLEENIFSNNRNQRAFGMFFQTTEDSKVENNLFLNNSIGIYSDLSRGNRVKNNTFIQSDIGMEILGSNWDNEIYQNNFIDNLQQVSVNEMEIRDQWHKNEHGNYWSDYTGIDIEKDGTGDKEYHSGSALEYLMYQYPHLRLFVESPASKMLKAVDKMFPIVDRAKIVDPYPMKNEWNSAAYVQYLEKETSKKAGMLTFVLSLVFTLLSFGTILGITKRFARR